jgi:hypothetical protein
MLSTANEFTEDPTELARIVIDPARLASQRENAWNRLVPVIRRVAEEKAGFCREAVENAVGCIWEMLDPGASGGQGKYDPTRGNFVNWCAVVIYRHALDLQRQEKRRPAVLLPAECEEKGAGGRRDPAVEREAHVETLLERKERLRGALDRIGPSFGSTAHGTDYFAVLLLKLRLAMAKQVVPADVLEAVGGHFADFLAWCLPWIGAEPGRCFRAGWPTLAAIWTDIGKRLEQPPHALDGAALCERLSCLLGVVITPDVWNHWVKSAKNKAQSCLAAEEWQSLFAPFFPDRHALPRGESKVTK